MKLDKDVDIYAPTLLPDATSAKSVLIITADDVHDLEFFYPYYRLVEEGFSVDVASPEGGSIKGKAGWEIKNTRKISSVDPALYDLLFIPGGKAPAKMRKSDELIGRVQQFAASGKPIAAFCHGPQVLVTANVIKGKKLTAWPEVEEEITEAGGFFTNSPLVEDGQFITSRWPGDLPGHVKAIIKRLNAGSAIKSEPARKVV